MARCTTEEAEVVVETPLAFLQGQFSICAQFALQMGLFSLAGVTGVFGRRRWEANLVSMKQSSAPESNSTRKGEEMEGEETERERE